MVITGWKQDCRSLQSVKFKSYSVKPIYYLEVMDWRIKSVTKIPE